MHVCWAVVMAIIAVCSARASVVLSPLISGSGSDLIYNYTVTNTETLGIIAIDLSIPVAPNSVSGPPGWIANPFANGSGFVVQWLSTTSEVAAETSQSDFILVAPGVPGNVSFTATNADLQTLTGTTTGPVEAGTIPEPATLLTAPIAVAGILLLRVAQKPQFMLHR
jgi:hypothetical protein